VITKPTTFVLGAGFSYELGMPLGSKLKSDIRAEALRVLSGNNRSPLDVCLEAAFANSDIEVEHALTRIAAALDYHASIDGLVEHFADVPGVAVAARHLIADRILWYEAKREWARVGAAVIGQEERQVPQIHQANNSGMKSLFDLLMAQTTRKNVERAFEKIGFVNFNYDRTLEQYLFLAMIERSGLAPSEAEGIVRNLRIWRPYGSVGKLALVNGRGSDAPEGFTAFGAGGVQSLYAAAKGIRTYSEADEGAVIRDAHQFMAQSDVVVFLGCAYHSQNLNLMRRPDSLRLRTPRVFGTHYAPPPVDMDGNAVLAMERFLQPAAAALHQRLWNLLGPARGSIVNNVVLEPLTSRQLIEMYGPVWT